jgi:patatin-like phospholipase/acyl hydrolase
MTEAGNANSTTIVQSRKLFRVLTLDGGGAKGFYTLGVLKEIELMTGCPLHESFDLVYGTSTGAIIATLLALGYTVDQVHDLYRTHVPTIMKHRLRRGRTAALSRLAETVFKKHTPEDFKTGIVIVATHWLKEKPMLFKSDSGLLHGRKASYVPFHGVSIADAVQASCSAFPFFSRKFVQTGSGDKIELIDGGFCANNPALYAIADAVAALKKNLADIRLVSIGVGVYPQPSLKLWNWSSWKTWLIKKLPSVQLLQKTLEINTQSMDQIREILFRDIPTVRINDTFSTPSLATDLLEHDLDKLNSLRQQGRESFGKHENNLRAYLLANPYT